MASIGIHFEGSSPPVGTELAGAAGLRGERDRHVQMPYAIRDTATTGFLLAGLLALGWERARMIRARRAAALVLCLVLWPGAAFASPRDLPNPSDCAEGAAEPITAGDSSTQFAICVGAVGLPLLYLGGDVSTPCGAIIVGTQMVIGSWGGPDDCPDPVEPGPGVAGSRFAEAVRGPKGAVATISPLAGAVGSAVLAGGGNAADAAIAAVFAVGVVRPDQCGIGGDGAALYRTSSGEVSALDFRVTIPGKADSTTFDEGGVQQFSTGYRNVGVPGVVAGLAALHSRYGTRPWADLVRPAEQLARQGFRVSSELAQSYEYQESFPGLTASPVPGIDGLPKSNALRLRVFPDSAANYLMAGALTPYPGSTLRQPDYADSLAAIADAGQDAFYKGSIAAAIAAEMARSAAYPEISSTMTAADLAAYEARWRDPVSGTYRGDQVVAAAPSSGGGVFLVEALNILEGFELGSAGHSSADHLHLLAEAEKIAWSDRTAHIGDPDFVDVPVARLTSKAYAAERRAEIDPLHAKSFGPAAVETENTTHVSVVDADGNAAAVTCSLGPLFGSAVVAKGTGFLLNAQLYGFTPRGTPNEAVGGKRPLTSATPAIVVRDGRPILVVGGGGGTTIPMGILHSVVNVIDFGMPIDRALDAARSTEQVCCSMALEDARIPASTQSELVSRGHQIVSLGEYSPLPYLHAAGFDLTTHELVAAADPRAEQGAVAA